MEVVSFIVFIFVSHQILMQIFRFSTYHKYFFMMLPILILFGILVAWLLYYFEMHSFFLWLIFLEVIWLRYVWKKDDDNGRYNLLHYEENSEDYKIIKESMRKTDIFYFLSSIVYIIAVSVVYLWLFNT